MFYTSWHPNKRAPAPDRQTTAVSNHQEGIREAHVYMSVISHTNGAQEGFNTDFIFYLLSFCDNQY